MDLQAQEVYTNHITYHFIFREWQPYDQKDIVFLLKDKKPTLPGYKILHTAMKSMAVSFT